MATEDESERWDWSEGIHNIDEESPLGLTHSMWNDFTYTEVNACSLFESTPVTEARVEHTSISAWNSQGNGESVWTRSLHQIGPCLKRRRMLLFTGGVPQSGPGTGAMHYNSLEDFEDIFQELGDPNLTMDCNGMLDTNGGKSKLVSSPTRIVRSLDIKEPQLLVDQIMKASVLPTEEMPARMQSLEMQSFQQICKLSTTRTAVLPASGQAPNNVEMQTRPTSNLVYPFALLKPSAVQGDLTLHDINRRILMSQQERPASSQQQQQQEEERKSDRHNPHPRGVCGWPSSSTAVTREWERRRAKSVSGVTRIHTQGNGSITIVRRRERE